MLDFILYFVLGALSVLTTYLGAHMAVSPPVEPRAKSFYKQLFIAICVVSVATIVTIGIRQYRAAARADAAQKELQETIDNIRKDLNSAEVVRRLTGEGYLVTKDVPAEPGIFLPGHEFKVNVVTENGGAGRVNDPLTVSTMRMVENAGTNSDRKVREELERQTMKYRAGFPSGQQAPQIQGSGERAYVTMKYHFAEGDIEALQKDTKRLYVFSLYGWTDSQGQRVFATDCRFLQAKTVPQSYQDKDIVWQRCH